MPNWSWRTNVKIIIPNVFRIDYLGALRKLSRQQEPEVYIRMLQRAQLFSATIKGDSMDICSEYSHKATPPAGMFLQLAASLKNFFSKINKMLIFLVFVLLSPFGNVYPMKN
jgi:hypothetical protein